MAPSTDVVLAGSKAFALALFAPVTERVGSRPRIAPEPQQALTLCAGSSGLLLVEFSEAWLPVLKQLRAQAPGLRVVAALPQGQEAAVLALAPLGVEAVPWDGQAAPILAAVTKVLAAGAVASSPASQGVTRPPIAPAATAPPAAARPMVPQAPRAPATTPAGGTPAAPVAPRVPATTPPRPIPVAPAAPRAPATTPAAGTPAAPPGARPPATTPAGGTPAVSAPQPAQAAAPPAAAPPAAAPPVVPATPPTAPPASDLFDDLEPAEAAPEAQSAPALAPYTLPPAAEAPAHAGHWPSGLPSEDEAESALVLYTRGKLRPDAPLAAVTRDAVKGMSELERQVVGGAELPFDGQPIYKAAVLRLRVAAALATVPTEQARVDDAAVQALLAELDGVLALVNPLAMAAPPEHQPALEAVRNALVREAVDFSEAAHRVSAGGAPPERASTRPVARSQAPVSRVLSLQAGEEEEPRVERRRRAPVAVLILLVLAIAGVLVWQEVARPPVKAPPSFDGAPANTVAVTNGPYRLMVVAPGKQVDPGELARFRSQEEKKGNVVTEVAPGNWLIEAAQPAAKGATP